MKLPYEQDLLIKEVLKANPNTIIVMMGGSPVEMHKWINQAQAVVWNWYSGMEGGRALAEVLFGKVNPSGKLPETFYVRHTDCSAHAVGEFPAVKRCIIQKASLSDTAIMTPFIFHRSSALGMDCLIQPCIQQSVCKMAEWMLHSNTGSGEYR